MKVYSNVGVARVGRSAFNLSHERKLTCDMGELIPVMCEEMVPGDIFKIGHQVVLRFQPLVAPIMHEVNCYIHTFFVPYRLLMTTELGDDGSFEDFITGGVEGDDSSTLPTWEPTDTAVGSLWDYLGFPTGIDPVGAYPIDFPKRAYNFIFNEYYRDENLVTELDITTEEDIKVRSWEKDRFTSCLPWQQRGTAPALPISGVIDVDGKDQNILLENTLDGSGKALATHSTAGNVYVSGSPTSSGLARWTDPALEVDLSGATTFDVADLRLAFQVQKWMERNARAGVRYKEFLLAHFGTSVQDSRLQRPEYIGGLKSPIIVSEVLQTSETLVGTAQGNMTGHGIGVDNKYIGSYRAREFGLVMSIMSVMPRSAYSQGIDKQWLKETKYDFYFPEFANLSEEAIIRAELYANGVSNDNNTVFGYQGRYDHMRVKESKVCGDMRSTFDYWHIGRQFGSAPTLNETFVSCIPRKDIFAAPSEDGLIVNIGNLIKAIRPMPIMANPGLIDH